MDPEALTASSETSASARSLAASLQAPRRGFGDEQGAASNQCDICIVTLAVLGWRSAGSMNCRGRHTV